jgi:hypothetical protein
VISELQFTHQSRNTFRWPGHQNQATSCDVTKTKQRHVMSPKCNKHIAHQIKPSPVFVAQEAQYTFRDHDTSPKLHWITEPHVHLLHKKHPSRKHATTNVISQPPATILSSSKGLRQSSDLPCSTSCFFPQSVEFSWSNTYSRLQAMETLHHKFKAFNKRLLGLEGVMVWQIMWV